MSGKTKLLVITILITIVSLSTVKAFAANTEKDSDFDGISDKAELELYRTDPNKADTDEDGVLDYQEVLDKTDPANSNSSGLNLNLSNELFAKSNATMWYIGRISGIGAFVMFTLVVCFGLLMTSKILVKFPFFSAPNALEVHSFNASFIGMTLLAAHILALMSDTYIQIKPKEVLIPFILQRNLVSSMGFDLKIPVALGVIALYLALILVTTSRLRKSVIPLKIWRAVHYSSFLFYLLFLIHGFTAGSDSREFWMQGLYLVSLVLVLGLTILRIFGKKLFLPQPAAPTTNN